jgi:hypothetical protein
MDFKYIDFWTNTKKQRLVFYRVLKGNRYYYFKAIPLGNLTCNSFRISKKNYYKQVNFNKQLKLSK